MATDLTVPRDNCEYRDARGSGDLGCDFMKGPSGDLFGGFYRLLLLFIGDHIRSESSVKRIGADEVTLQTSW
jgi:hypothetical protein